MSVTPSDQSPRVLLSGLAYVESPRWHDNRLWFAHWGTGEIVAVDLDGNSEVVGQGPPGLGWSIDWLPDGRLLVTGQELLRREPDGSMVRHADLSAVADHGWNEIVVDGRGNIYVNGAGFDFLAGAPPKPGIIALVTPDGLARQVADGIGPYSICLDADGAIWTHSADTRTHTGNADSPEGECVRVREGGEILQRVTLDRAGFACMLGGPDRRTLFMLAADWRGTDKVDEAIAARTGQVLVMHAPAPGVGWP
jgi:sugar lactone lactonase YvrE